MGGAVPSSLKMSSEGIMLPGMIPVVGECLDVECEPSSVRDAVVGHVSTSSS